MAESLGKSLISGDRQAAWMPKVRDALNLLAANGWIVKRVRGSHRQFGHPLRPGIVTVAGKPSADLAPGTWQAILRQAGLDDQRLK
jgi:predicted RNA binding protein YcfA (HicA-like mRNA interferase family)